MRFWPVFGQALLAPPVAPCTAADVARTKTGLLKRKNLAQSGILLTIANFRSATVM